jgi:hypothetical protein
MFHESFDQNEDAVLDRMEEAIRKCAGAVTPGNLSSTIAVLKQLGRSDRVSSLLQDYVNGRQNEERAFWDLEEQAFGSEVKDVDVRAAFERKLAMCKHERVPAEILAHIGLRKSWNPEDVDYLASLDSDQFYEIFKARRGYDLRVVLYGALMFQNMAGATDKMKKVTEHAETALRKVAQESDKRSPSEKVQYQHAREVWQPQFRY